MTFDSSLASTLLSTQADRTAIPRHLCLFSKLSAQPPPFPLLRSGIMSPLHFCLALLFASEAQRQCLQILRMPSKYTHRRSTPLNHHLSPGRRIKSSNPLTVLLTRLRKVGKWLFQSAPVHRFFLLVMTTSWTKQHAVCNPAALHRLLPRALRLGKLSYLIPTRNSLL